MNKFLINNNLIINSKGEIILFNLDNQNEVKYTKYGVSNKQKETLSFHQNNIFRYAVTIDMRDNIHLITLTKLGELNYSICKDNNWSNAMIAKFDFKSNMYNYMDILLEDKSVNIIYNYANLINSKLWTIQHVIGSKQNWDKYNIVSFMADKTFAQFHTDIDSFGTIHLLYSSMEGKSYHIYHTFYNSYTKKWNPIPKKLSSPNTSTLFPYLFVDTKDNLHAVWLEKLNMDNTLKYCRLSSKENEKYIWKQIKIPYISDCNNMPIISEEKGILKIIYSANKSIGFLYSSDNGTNWYKGDELEIDPSKVSLVKVSENFTKSDQIKINHAYCTIDQSLYFYFLNSITPIDTINTDNPSEDEPISQIEMVDSQKEIIESQEKIIGSQEEITLKANNILKTQESIILKINSLLESQEEIALKVNNLLESQEEIKNSLYKTIDSQNRIEEKIENIFETLNAEKNSIFDKLFRSSK